MEESVMDRIKNIDEGLARKIAELKAQAKLIGKNGVKPRTAIQNGSSLHRIIKTPEQAKAFMKNLKAAGEEE
ncbi:MAG: hypothetical protein JST68_10170 [Bacteroidetes bacterium]|nr:hypothetical protein [Bacteroidota bacterium]